MKEIIVIDDDDQPQMPPRMAGVDGSCASESIEIDDGDGNVVMWPKGIKRLARNRYPKHYQLTLTSDIGLCACICVCDTDCINLGIVLCTEDTCNVMKLKANAKAQQVLSSRRAQRARQITLDASTWECRNFIPDVSVESVTDCHEYLSLTLHPSGYGIIAKRLIPANKRVIEYVGIVTPHSRLKLDKKGQAPPFAMLLSDTSASEHLYIDAEKAGNLSRFINHTCDHAYANMKIMRYAYGNTWRIFIVSKREVNPGEPVLMHYQKKVSFICMCPSPKCRSCIP